MLYSQHSCKFKNKHSQGCSWRGTGWCNWLKRAPEHTGVEFTKSCLLNLMPTTYFILEQNTVLPAYNIEWVIALPFCSQHNWSIPMVWSGRNIWPRRKLQNVFFMYCQDMLNKWRVFLPYCVIPTLLILGFFQQNTQVLIFNECLSPDECKHAYGKDFPCHAWRQTCNYTCTGAEWRYGGRLLVAESTRTCCGA